MSPDVFLPHTLPLIQAPMAGCQDQGLAIAVSQAGALGSLPAALLDPAALEPCLQALQDSGRPYNVNFFAHRSSTPSPQQLQAWSERLAPWYAERGLGQVPMARPGRRAFDAASAEVLSGFRPSVVSFHFGLPEPALLRQVRSTGARVMATATSLDEALYLQSRGVDAVIAQGLEAGGHRGHFLNTDPAEQAPLERLLAQLLPRLSVPVIAAGGIATASQVERLLAQGVAAVQVGTAFLLCDEGKTSALHRRRLKTSEGDTVLTAALTGGLARGLPNRISREFAPLTDELPPFPWLTATLAPLREWAEARGLDDFTPLWCGTRHQALLEGPAEQIVRRLMGRLAAQEAPHAH